MAVYVGLDSFVPVGEECLELFRSMKLSSAYKYIMYKLGDVNSKVNKVVAASTSTPSHVPVASCRPPTTSSNWSITANHTLSLGIEPILTFMGALDIPNLFELRTVCKTWCKIIDENEERLLHASLIANKHIKRSFVASSVGFTSWRHLIMERMYEKRNYNQVWKDFSNSLPENEGRYIVYKFHEPTKKPYYVFILWSPDSSSVRGRMMYASTKMTFLKGLQKEGVQQEQQACALNELAQVAHAARSACHSSSSSTNDKVFSI